MVWFCCSQAILLRDHIVAWRKRGLSCASLSIVLGPNCSLQKFGLPVPALWQSNSRADGCVRCAVMLLALQRLAQLLAWLGSVPCN
mmetsp:Transcript_31699/g.77300  ORF Transcript_31699/g.77300 Transcript_31699/m.77300 type:complete len:86 (-) Transcript_31699:22-279(-)